VNSRRILLELFDGALRELDGGAAVTRILERLGPQPVALFAVGKAASSMTRGAHAALGAHIRQTLLITKDGHVDPEVRALPHVHVIESAHPVPDARSLEAGAELERRLASLAPDHHPVFLVSGGSSSLAELLQPGITLDDMRDLNQRGLGAGWDIARLNAERARLSRLKGGGVARMLHGRPAHALFISDVPGDDPAVIGSGLLGPAPGVEDRILRIITGNIEVATRCVAGLGAAHGLAFETRNGRFSGDAAEVAREFVAALRATEADGLVWGGESTVTLPASPGRGGRNQHLALAAAQSMRKGDAFTILAAGTDGTDGPTDDAGAIVDAGTIERAELGGVDVERALREFDSALALEAAEDLLHTGPTGTNVGDILIGIKQNARRFRDPAPPRML
jgi:hydroxypyruvate reductase